MSEPNAESWLFPRSGQPSRLRDVLPFLSSLSVHAGVIVFGVLTYQAVRVARESSPPDQLLVPVSTLFVDQPPSDFRPMGDDGASFKRMAQSDSADRTPKFSPSQPTSIARRWTELSGANSAAEPSSQSFGPGSMFGPAGSSAGGGTDTGSSYFGTGNGDGSGIGGRVFTQSRGARSIIFVCDGTGSMINKIAQLKIELNRTIHRLKPIQSFNVIFYQDEKVLKLSDDKLLAANAANIRKAETWLGDIIIMGGTDPVPALTAALRAKPQLVYFLTDAADFPDVKAVQNVFARLNADHQTKVNTILFVESKEEQRANKESEPLMQGISAANGGLFKWVVLDDLQ